MQTEKISELDTLATADNNDVLVINDVSEEDTMKITKQNLLKELKTEIDNIKNILYPIGYVYISVSDSNPSSTLGIGTWERIKDKFLLCSGDTYSVGATGGNATHTLTIQEMPAHTHGGIRHLQYGSSDIGYSTNWIEQNYVSAQTDSTGGGQAFSIMPPYLAVYVWKRVS